ncbi:MAG: DUF4349 domain-containing protein [Microbacterium sp.]
MTDNTPTPNLPEPAEVHEGSELPALPDLSDAAVARIEAAVFSEIESEGPPVRVTEHARARRRGWLATGGIAAAFVVGVLVTPPILSAVGTPDPLSAVGDYPVSGGGFAPEMGDGTATGESSDAALGAVSDSALQDADVGHEIISSANATIEVENVADAIAEISSLAEAHGGYAERTDSGTSVTTYSTDGSDSSVPIDSGYGWISIRIPSADLPVVMDALADTGEVLSSSISRQDVTATSIDLKARVDALTASVQRLTELMAQSGSVAELIDAEVALTERQAELQSYQQQLSALEDQVTMSSLQVQLTSPAAPVADPAGFGDGFEAGWKGLVVSLDALVIALGFIIPWAAVAGVVFLVVWLFLRARRRRLSTQEQGRMPSIE